MTLRRFTTSLIILVSLVFFAMSLQPAQAAEIKIAGAYPNSTFKVTQTGVEYSLSMTLEASSVAKIKTIEGTQSLKNKTTGKIVVNEKTSFPKQGNAYATAATYTFAISLTPDQVTALGDKAEFTVEVSDFTDRNKPVRLGGVTTPFAVSANVVPDNTPALKSWYKFEEKDGQLTGTVSWDTVTGATHYTITRTNEGKGATIIAQSLSSEEITTKFQKLEATDKFTVSAYGVNNKNQPFIIAQGVAIEAGVVRAQTEFGNLANIGEYIQKVMKYALPVGITLAVIMTIVAGINLILSQGSPDKIKSSKEGIQGAITGLIILILVRLLVEFLYIPSIDTTPNQPSFFSQAASEKGVI